MSSLLTEEGINDWRNISSKIKLYKTNIEHLMNTSSWIELETRLKGNTTIHKSVQYRINKEKEHWKEVLVRIIAIVRTLASNNLAFHRGNEKIYERNNGFFY